MSTGTADRVIFHESFDAETPEELRGVANDMNVNWIEDQQSGNYSAGQMVFDTSTLTNNGQFFDYHNATLEIPILATLSNPIAAGGTTAISKLPNGFAVAFKDLYTNIINSMQVEINGQTIVASKPYLNHAINYTIKSSFSTNEQLKWGQLLGLNTDTGGSYRFSVAASVDGDGYSNNRVASAAAAFDTPDLFNDGLYNRAKSTSQPSNGYGSIPVLTSGSATAKNNYCAAIGKPYCTLTTPTKDDVAGTVLGRWYVLATIRLKDVLDVFDKLKLVRGMQMRITIGLNQSISTITVGTTGTKMSLKSNPIMNSGLTNPVMITSAATANPNIVANGTLIAGPTPTTELQLAVGVAGNALDAWNSSTGATNLPLQKARMYINSYVLHDDKLREYIAHPIHTITHSSQYDYKPVSGVEIGANTTVNISQTVRNPKYVLGLPYANTASGVFATATCPVYQSPFDTAPATTTPLASITQLQVQVSGKNVFYQNEAYDFDQFINEFSKINAINGNEIDGLTSGLISPYLWDNAYRAVVADLSRFNTPENRGLPVSIDVSYVNNTAVKMDYIWFVFYDDSFDLNVLDGSIKK